MNRWDSQVLTGIHLFLTQRRGGDRANIRFRPRLSQSGYRHPMVEKGHEEQLPLCQGRTAVVGFESGPWLQMVDDVNSLAI